MEIPTDPNFSYGQLTSTSSKVALLIMKAIAMTVSQIEWKSFAFHPKLIFFAPQFCFSAQTGNLWEENKTIKSITWRSYHTEVTKSWKENQKTLFLFKKENDSCSEAISDCKGKIKPLEFCIINFQFILEFIIYVHLIFILLTFLISYLLQSLKSTSSLSKVYCQLLQEREKVGSRTQSSCTSLYGNWHESFGSVHVHRSFAYISEKTSEIPPVIDFLF